MSGTRANMEIDAQAADWATRIDLGPLSPADNDAFNEWAAANVLHRGAYARAAAMLEYAKRAKALGDDYDPAEFREEEAAQEDAVPIDRPTKFYARRGFLAGAASMAAAGVAVVLGYDTLFKSSDYQTATGEMKRIFLDDGSVLTLNTASRARVAFSKAQRRVELIEGEALFDVAKDAARPFTVTAGPTSVTAVGTSFTVRNLADAAVGIIVREGVVKIGGSDGGGRTILAKANTRIIKPSGTAAEVTRLDESQVTQQLAWETGMLSFESVPLSEAVAEFRRYSVTQIAIPDSAIAKESVTGRFAANDPEGFATAVATSLGVRAEKRDGQVFIER